MDRKRELVLEAEVEGRKFDFSNQKLTIAPEFVKLHFLRYGLFRLNGETYTAEMPTAFEPLTPNISLGNPLAVPQGVPDLNNYFILNAILEPGYLYVFDANDPDLWYEYRVDEKGFFHEIRWESSNPKNYRKSNGGGNDFVLMECNKILWVVFSTVQWSVDFHKTMRTDAAKAKYMKRVECTGFELSDGGQNDVCAYDKIQIEFTKDQEKLAKRAKRKLQRIAKKEGKDKEKENYYRKDMFITIDDPVNMANSITIGLSEQIRIHRANIDAMRFGKNPKYFEKLAEKGALKKSVSKKELQQSSMFTLAQTIYQLIYNSEENIAKFNSDKIGQGWYDFRPTLLQPGVPVIPGVSVTATYDRKGLYKKKLVNILGVEERKKQRNLIRSMQKDLAAFLKCSYFDNALRPFSEDEDLNNIIGKSNLYLHLSFLAINPHDYDRSFDLQKDQEKTNEFENYLVDRLHAKSSKEIDKTIGRPINIDDEIVELALNRKIDLANKLASFFDKLIETASQLITKKAFTQLGTKVETLEESLKVMVTLLKKHTVYGVVVFDLKKSELENKVPGNSRILAKKVKYKGSKDIVRYQADYRIELLSKNHGPDLFKVDVETTNTTTTTNTTYRDVPTDSALKAEKFLNSKVFRRTVALLQVFNLGAAIGALSEDFNTKNGVQLVGISSELTEALLRLKEASIIRSGGKGFASGSYYLKALDTASIAGAAITTVMCVWDAYDSFDAHDGDAGWAYLGAAVAFGGLTAVTVASVMASATVGGPLGWICAGVGLGFMYLAYKLTDTPLEKFFKHSAFSDVIPLEFNGDPAWKYNQRFYKFRQQLTDPKYHKEIDLSDFVRASAELHDLLVCSRISFEATKTIRNTEEIEMPPKDFMQPLIIREGYATEFEVAISFNQFLKNEDQLSYKVFYYPQGMEQGHVEIAIERAVRIEKGSDAAPPKAIVTIRLSAEMAAKATIKSQLLFVCRLNLEGDNYYPVDFQLNHRMLAAVVSIRQLEASGVATYSTHGSHTKIAPLSDIVKPSTWGKR